MFASSGDMTAPCGVPFIAGRLTPSSTTPAFSHLRIRRSTRWSPIRCSTNRIIHSWADVVEEPADVGVQYPVHRSVLNANHKRVQRVVLAPSGPKPVGEADEVRLVDCVENLDDRALDDLVLQRGDAERALPPVRLRDVGT